MAKDDLGAKMITLNTIAPEELAEDSPMRIKTGKPVPKASSFVCTTHCSRNCTLGVFSSYPLTTKC